MQIYRTPLAICVLFFVVSIHLPHTHAQALCDTAGCLNGVCLLPPAVATPTCNCSQGFSPDPTNPNVCNVADFDECTANPYICGYAYNPTYGQYGPTGTCVNAPGTYYCMCYPPFMATYMYKSCYYYQPPQQNVYQDLYSWYLFSDAFDFGFD
ncbi:latent-transforming growth factor beta-binding protein 4-like [Haliotis cracherodii]|uniref:latent-transforming growth factor beta-binding protein 4-like n=1 Tax=Haliotis cracherodii TaxID=6455 RepID=UPI0039EBEC07